MEDKKVKMKGSDLELYLEVYIIKSLWKSLLGLV